MQRVEIVSESGHHTLVHRLLPSVLMVIRLVARVMIKRGICSVRNPFYSAVSV